MFLFQRQMQSKMRNYQFSYKVFYWTKCKYVTFGSLVSVLSGLIRLLFIAEHSSLPGLVLAL